MRRLAPLFAILPLAVQAPAHADDRPPLPVCAQPQVLLLVAEQVQRPGRSTTIEPGSIGEIPNPTPNPAPNPATVRCALRLHTIVYDTVRAGPVPQDLVTTFNYTLELRQNAIFLIPGPYTQP